MIITRRQFAALSAGAAMSGIALPRSLASFLLEDEDHDNTVFDWSHINTNVHVAMGYGGNAMVYTTPRGSVLVDCKNAGLGDTLRREAQEAGGRLMLVINTHHHGDHTGGNYAFVQDIPLVAQEKALARVRGSIDAYKRSIQSIAQNLRNSQEARAASILQDAGSLFDRIDALEADDFVPTQPVVPDGGSEEVAQGIEVGHHLPSHTDNDIGIYLKNENVIHMGDLLFNNLHPYLNRNDGASTAGWIKTLNHIKDEVCDSETVVIPGHGDVTNVKGIERMISYLQRTREAVAGAIEEGRTREEITQMQFPHFEGLGFEQLRANALEQIYDELTAE